MKLKIKELPGVHPAEEDTKKLAEIAASYKKATALDLGTGTGYCGIWLAKQGAMVDATDVSEKALLCAEINSKLNNVSMNIFFSDMFENITGKYELIIYNPPINTNENDLQRKIKAVIKKTFLKNIMSRITCRICQEKRVANLNYFINQARNYLTQNGVIIIHLVRSDIQYLNQNLITMVEKTKISPHTAIFEIKYKNIF